MSKYRFLSKALIKVEEIKKEFNSDATLFGALNRLVKSGKIIKLKGGLYATVNPLTKDIFVLKNELIEMFTHSVNICLPDKYYITTNNNFQLFYRGVVMAVNPYNYSISASCAKGNTFPRYYQWKPTSSDVGEYKLTLTVKDDNGKLLGSDETILVVEEPTDNVKTKNVLCIGDSLTSGGVWVGEAFRRYCLEGGNPVGLGYDYLNFIGTVIKTINGRKIGYEGYGGWTWQRFLSNQSPFYDEESKTIDFKTYCERNDYSGIDLVYILLTWNGFNKAYKNDFDLNKEHLLYAQ